MGAQQQQQHKIEAEGLKKIKGNKYRFHDSSLWFFQGELIVSNTAEVFKIISVGDPEKIGDYYIIESENEITPANLKRIKTFQLQTNE